MRESTAGLQHKTRIPVVAKWVHCGTWASAGREKDFRKMLPRDEQC